MKKLLLVLFIVGISLGVKSQETELKQHDTLQECTADAWDYGTEMAGGNPDLEWYWTDWYFETHCE